MVAGDTLGFRGPWGTTYPANLRLFMNSLTQDQWAQFSKSFQSHPPMPWWLLHDMNRPDRKALYAYVRWLGPLAGRRRVLCRRTKSPSAQWCSFRRRPTSSDRQLIRTTCCPKADAGDRPERIPLITSVF